MNPPRGLRRFEVVETREAVQLTPDNLDAVAAWCGGRAGVVEGVVDFRTEGGHLATAEVGDWIVRDPNHRTPYFHMAPACITGRDRLPNWRDVTDEPPASEPPALGVLTGTPLRITRR